MSLRRTAAGLLVAALIVTNLAPVAAVADDPGATTSTTTPNGSSATITSRPPDTSTTAASGGTAATALIPPPTNGGITASTPVVAPTTAVAPTTVTTVDPAVLAGVVQGIDVDLARAKAINDYLAARALVGQPAAAQSVGAQSAGASPDPALQAAAASELAATAARDAAATRFTQARYRVGQLAIALYTGNQNPPDGLINDSLGERDALLTVILEKEKSELDVARQDLAGATDAFNRSRSDAEQLVNSRAISLVATAPVGGRPSLGGAPPDASSNPPASNPPVSNPLVISPLVSSPPLSVPRRPTPSLPPALASLSPSILGSSTLTAPEITGWYQSTGRPPHITVPLETLVADFESLGAVAGVRADLAFAQSMVETGYLNFPGYGQVAVSDNNFAGIGACDGCSTGWHFPDAATGVAAQLQLLHAYAVKGPAPGPLTSPVRVSGCCATWLALAGVWATNPNYGYAILKTYRAMVEWALARRSAAAGL